MKTLFVAPTRNGVGLTSTALGLLRALERQGLKVAFLKPIAQTHETAPDDSVHFARTLAHAVTPDPIPLSVAEEQLSQGQEEDLMESVVALAREAAAGVTGGADVLVAEGLALNERNNYAGRLNASLARNLEADVVLVSSLSGVTPAALADELEIAVQAYRRSDGSGLAGYVLNFAPLELDFGGLLAELRARSRVLASGELPLLGVIAQSPALGAPRTLDVARYLGAEILNEGEAGLRRVTSTVVTARSVPKMADLFTSGALVVTPGDREDVVMAASLSHLSGVPLAGLMFTSGSAPEASIEKLCRAALTSTLPVLRVETNSYNTASRLSRMDARVPHDDLERMERIIDFIADRLDTVPLGTRLRAPGGDERRLPPSAFRYELIQKARAAGKRIVLPEGDEPRTVRAAIRCVEKGIARCVLLAKPEKVRQVAEGQSLTLPEGLEVLDPESIRANYVAPMVDLRKSKGLTAPMAEAQLEDNVVLGTMMLALGEVDGLVSGAVHTTANTVRPALQLIKTAPGVRLVSSIFFMLMPEQVLVYGDAAINPNPNAEELADIAIQSADSARAFGIPPRIAMLSYSTGESGAGEDVEKVKVATQLVRERRPDLPVDGPLQYDAASVLSVGRQKAPNSPVAGRATVFIFPDLNTGNTTYKAVQRAAGVVAVGPMLQGLRKPVNDLSRGALVDDIVYTIALTAIQATQGS
ncbi:phosphate acetyltransferase [Deinococcus metallilatus]|uniref:Phosphate acetyltransferase n=1 Tax=Deinococcus metallilatus TaxID=1211322 RepID=A0AAJ5F4I6_9DEIO|nr:phosphate acetyltransferase [Deinococcus metallilatus]MBB5294475.1 phosphate acetyltransferase [Deinococcus metallilatus]QBY07529.1 phosphate acetyltransferase [Deinococcus metallilatus]RXJ13945.1 phosphate acetyltransferase [Deinococcus metallilatus]TLK29910.1 phosphate acetyltransferase [Deinococcus metallilatus]GMA15691.1 phosphate acetyltransferase [Deinococcus metallilatus]